MLGNLGPVIAGNVVGGSVLVALVYWVVYLRGRSRVSDTLRAELSRVASRLGAEGIEFVLERPRDAGHGDLATNLAMVVLSL